MLVINPTDRISLPEILCHPWLKNIIGPDGLPLDGDTEDDDDFHDFNMSLSLQRQECNLNPLSVKTGEITERCQNAMDEPKTIQQIGNINVINIENLFFNERANKCKLSYMNYCAVTQDFNTYHIDEEALRVLESFGYARSHVINSLN